MSFLKSLELRSENSVDELWVGNEKYNFYGIRWLEKLKITNWRFVAKRVPVFFENLKSLEQKNCVFEQAQLYFLNFVYGLRA